MIAKLIRGLCSFAVMLVLSASITCVNASALNNGVYIAKATPHYRHPVTGKIEDSGGESSSVLGQSMTESALYPQALIEVDTDGKKYATVRIKLMDNIENPKFKVQKRGASSFTDVSADVMKEDYYKNQTDFRFQIPDEKCIVRATFYVVPMGRSVIFYIDFSEIKQGSGDFVTSVRVVTQQVTTKTSTPTASSQTAKTTTETQRPQSSASSRAASSALTSQGTGQTRSDTDSSGKVTSRSSNGGLGEETSQDSSDSSENEDSSQSGSETTRKSSAASYPDDTQTDEQSVSDDGSVIIPPSVDNHAVGAVFFNEKGEQIDPLENKRESIDKKADENRSIVLPIAIACAVCAAAVVGGIIAYRKRRA